MAVKKYIKKTFRNVKKRYTTRTGQFKPKNAYRDFKTLAREVGTIKRALNVEHKHIDFKFGSGDTADIIAQVPTKDTPLIIPLNLPLKGLNYNNRVGNQIKITHITSKLEFIFENNTDLIQRSNVRVQILFAKNASDVPTIEQLYELDSNGHYTPMSMVNTQEYKKFLWIKSHDHGKGYTQPTNRYPPSNSDGAVANPAYNTTGNVSAQATANQKLNVAQFYSNKKSAQSIKVMFKNLSNDIEMMKPYLVLRSDVIEAQPRNYDPITVSGIIRMTYVDN